MNTSRPLSTALNADMKQSTTNTRTLAVLKIANVNAMNKIIDPFILKPTLTADGRKWVQRCFICAKQVDFLKTMPAQRVAVGELVRHAKCRNYLR